MPDVDDAITRLRTGEGWLTASAADGRFSSLFGRDSLIAALQLVARDPTVADATLDRLRRELGRTVDDEREEEPGKVPHEIRAHDLEAYEAHGWPVHDGVLRYYGSADASSWFLIVYGALARGGYGVRAHQAAAREVASWLRSQAHPLAYERRATSGGLAHHGWRDVAADLEGNGHGVVAADGKPMRTPAALAAVGALAWRALADVAETLDRTVADDATRARRSWLETFLPDGPGSGVPAFARHPGGLDASATSDLGWILWTGILGPNDAFPVARRLQDDDLATPYGVRTLAAGHRGFRVDGYHTGTVWPFDSWLAAGGLDAAPGATGDAVRAGVLAALEDLDGFPELYVVTTDGALERHEESCATQAWTAGAAAAIADGWDGRSWAL